MAPGKITWLTLPSNRSPVGPRNNTLSRFRPISALGCPFVPMAKGGPGDEEPPWDTLQPRTPASGGGCSGRMCDHVPRHGGDGDQVGDVADAPEIAGFSAPEKPTWLPWPALNRRRPGRLDARPCIRSLRSSGTGDCRFTLAGELYFPDQLEDSPAE